MQLPIGAMVIFISLFLFYYYNQKASIKRQERRDRLQQKRQEQLEQLLKENKE